MTQREVKPRNNIQRAVQTQDPKRYRTRTVEPERGKGRKSRPRSVPPPFPDNICTHCPATLPDPHRPWVGHYRDCPVLLSYRLTPCPACGYDVPASQRWPYRGHADGCEWRRLRLEDLGPGQEGL